jgi:ribosome-binding protein aMBF1 (putative translation factor)
MPSLEKAPRTFDSLEFPPPLPLGQHQFLLQSQQVEDDTYSPLTHSHHPARILNMHKAQEGLIKRNFGEKLRSLRQARGLSQEGLALACALDRTYVGGVERGERNISLVNICKIAHALGVSAKELMP